MKYKQVREEIKYKEGCTRIYTRYVGNIVWSVWENDETKRTFLLCHRLIQSGYDDWSYIEENEKDPPLEVNCPKTIFKKAPDVLNEIWREKVLNSRKKTLKLYGKIIKLFKKAKKEKKTVRVLLRAKDGSAVYRKNEDTLCRFLDVVKILHPKVIGISYEDGRLYSIPFSKIEDVFILEDKENEYEEKEM